MSARKKKNKCSEEKVRAHKEEKLRIFFFFFFWSEEFLQPWKDVLVFKVRNNTSKYEVIIHITFIMVYYGMFTTNHINNY